MKLLMIIFPFLLFIFAACEDVGTSITDFHALSFNYKAYDTLGVLTAKGILNLTKNNSNISGSWQFEDGESGILAGRIDNDIIEIDLYPGWQDHNLVLHGRLSGNTYNGEWIMYGWAMLGRGTFTATIK